MGNKDFDRLLHCILFSSCEHELSLLSDQRLLRRYTGQHDEFALGEVIQRHGAMVWAICRRILGQSQAAEDVYQVAFLKLIRKAAFVQRCPSVESWLHKVVRAAAINARRQRDPQCVHEKRGAQMCEDGYTEPRDARDLADIVDEELVYLPEKCQRPIILCYLEGLTHEQAASRIHISKRCLKRILAEGRQRLQQRLSQRGIHLELPMLVAELTSNRHQQKVPPGLMERTLDMARIITQSNSVLEPPALSTEITVLVQRMWRTWTLKTKLVLGFLLVLLVVGGGSLITYSGWWNLRGEQPQERSPGPTKKVREKPETHESLFSKPLSKERWDWGEGKAFRCLILRQPKLRSARVSTPLGAGLLTPPLGDRRSPLLATGRIGCYLRSARVSRPRCSTTAGLPF